MAEFTQNEVQTVALDQNVLLQTSIPCNKGYVIHRNGSGIVTLRGIVNNSCPNAFARYQVTFNGNIAVPADGTAGPISISIALNGEALQTSRAIVTPTATEAYFNVTSTAFVDVPKGCCTQLSVENVSDEGAILVQNANLVVSRVA